MPNPKNVYRIYTIYDEIYLQHFKLVIGSKELANRYLKRAGYGHEISEGCNGCTIYSSTGGILIWIGKFDWTIGEQEILLHELTHLIFDTLGKVDVKYSTANNEAFCYYLGYIFRQVWKKLAKLHHSKKKKRKNAK